MIFHPSCCNLLPLYHRMLLQPFITTVYRQHSVSHTIMEFVTPVFKSPFPFFRTIANILNNTWSIFHLPINYVPIRPLLLPHGKFVGFLTVLTQSLSVSLFAENMGRFVRHDFLHNTVVVFRSISYSCISLPFLREQFLPNYSIFRSQI